ncbi:Glu/Leu/Phe/Val family dehydrogenase [Paradesulfitobacterium ferrireducens]|uniref:Glu/Leu/Phe/Val family dehydrogenase n=1 Tax=Paradesulfitobacterium ferrireducens TaxID=2816476 RepID=UPI001A902057|nr:Glu/Leu/Phe/Val dehydrogenase [Paradesulfitobacterium ferrireducens]
MKKTALEVAQEQLATAIEYMNLDQEIYELLKEPLSQLTVRIPVKMDDGTIRIFTGFRFQHNAALGPTRGGTRFHPEETPEDVKALSLWMTLKNALNEIPNGGAKGGIIVDPEKLSKGELERLCRAYVRKIAPTIGAWKDFPGADIGTSAETQSWMLDEWEALNLHHEPAGISGKLMVLGGSEGRPEATSRGLLYATRESVKAKGLEMKQLAAVVQGFGKVGWHLAKLYEMDGVKVVAVSDVHTGIYNPEGLDVKDVNAYMDRNGTLVGYPKAQAVSNSELLELECDILAPCAVQNVITDENAPRIKARFLIEGANGPTTPDAEKILISKGVFIAPDIWANSGGTQVAHFERVQNLNDDRWSEEEVNAKLERLIGKVFAEIYKIHTEQNISMRLACWVRSIGKVVDAMKARGWV